MRRTLTTFSLIAWFALPAALSAAPDEPTPLVAKSATLSIEGTSTMHDYALKTADLRIEATVASTSGGLEPGALQSFALRIPLESFTTDKDGLKKKMLETIKAEKHPVITFTLGRYTVDESAVRAHGALTVAGVTRDVALDLDVADTPEGIRVRGRRDLSMKEFGLKAPTMFLGMLKTSDMVTITFDLLLTPAARVGN